MKPSKTSKPMDSCEVQDGETLSKREQRKLELTLKQFQYLEPKPTKRRKTNELIPRINHNSEGLGSKTPDSSCKLDETENIEEAKEFTQATVTTIKPMAQSSPSFHRIDPSSESQKMPTHYNENYKIENGAQGIFQYLITYEIDQLKKKEQKDDAFRAGRCTISVPGKPLAIINSSDNQALLEKYSSITAPRTIGEKLYLFSKVHKEMREALHKLHK